MLLRSVKTGLLQHASVRMGLSVALGFVVLLGGPFSSSLLERLTAGWDATALALLLLSWWVMLRSKGEDTRRRAAAEDPGRTAVWLLVLLGSLLSFVSSVLLLHSIHWALALSSVLESWALTHTAYALRYAHLYYRDDGDGEGGLDFPGDGTPDDLDFAYFAFTVGMCFQVSDVTVSSRPIRRAVLVHALLSFGYSTVIVALTLNLLMGRLA